MSKRDFYLKAVMSLANGIPFTASLDNDEELSVSWETVENKTAPTDAQIDAEIARLQTEAETIKTTRQSALAKLMALGLTEEEALALGVK